jgi:capsule biosynthesis phosphatase
VRTFIIDVDYTICVAERVEGRGDYANARPRPEVIARINQLHDKGDRIVLFTARGMKTYGGDVEAIRRNVLPTLVAWLESNGVRYHEVVVGKPWYPELYIVDDRNLTINQFINIPEYAYETIVKANGGEYGRQ